MNPAIPLMIAILLLVALIFSIVKKVKKTYHYNYCTLELLHYKRNFTRYIFPGS